LKLPGKFRSFDGTRLAYRVWGESSDLTPVVCCSGIACDDLYWTFLAPELSKERQVVTWDYPWHGDSGPPEDRSEISVASLAHHADALLEYLSVPPAAFVGHSMGVQVILEFWHQYREDVAALIPIAGPFARTVGSLYGTGIGRYLLKLLETGAKLQPDLTALLWRTAFQASIADPIGRLGGLIGHVPAAQMERYFSHLRQLDPVGLLEMFGMGQAHSAEDYLDEIDVPVLIIHGKADVMSPFILAQQMAQRIPDAELVGVEGGAHTLPLEDPEMINSTVRNFLKARADSS
jgi:pimeloyl-ACP methyl ester carboxylesterase